jgi:uncharacterized protein YoaH (UPF0181 family)
VVGEAVLPEAELPSDLLLCRVFCMAKSDQQVELKTTSHLSNGSAIFEVAGNLRADTQGLPHIPNILFA